MVNVWREVQTGHTREFLRMQPTRPETLVAAVLHLMTHYARTGCPRLAACISQHLQCLCVHPDADPVIREICAGLHGVWTETATGRAAADSLH